MIVYNVKRRWFTMKADAETYRKAEGLPPSGTFKLDIRDRDDLAALLNGLTAIAPLPCPAPAEVRTRNQITDDVPDCVPKFLVDQWRASLKRREE